MKYDVVTQRDIEISNNAGVARAAPCLKVGYSGIGFTQGRMQVKSGRNRIIKIHRNIRIKKSLGNCASIICIHKS